MAAVTIRALKAGQPYGRAPVRVWLSDSSGALVVGYVDGVMVAALEKPADAAGLATFDLPLNSTVAPANTYYAATVGGVGIGVIEVTGAGEWEDLLVETPEPYDGSALAIHAALRNPHQTRVEDLADVDLTGLDDDDRLAWDDGAGEWVPRPPAAVGAHHETHETGGDDPVDLSDQFDALGAAAAAVATEVTNRNAAIAAEAVLARNADNLSSGTVPDARIPSGIARDSEVTTAANAAQAAAEATASNADNLTSGTVADARIPSGVARDSEVTAAIAALSTVYQPLDSDLTAIAALTTTAYGRAFLALADQAALVALLPSYQPLDSDLTSIAALATTSYGRAFLALADQAALVALLPSYQPLDSDLTAVAALTTTSYGRAFLELANQAALMALLSSASTSAEGKVELATLAEAKAGTDTSRAVTPEGVLGAIATRLINTQTGTSYTLVASDAGKLVTMSNASASSLTIPANASVAFDVGTQIEVIQLGAGQVTVGITSDTLRSTETGKLTDQYSGVVLTKIGTTEWIILGRVTT